MNTPPLPHATPSALNSPNAEQAFKVELPAPVFGPTVFADAQPHRPAMMRPADPQSWWRVPCQVTDHVFISGDIDMSHPDRAVEQLQQWLDLGITDIIDVRDEWSDEVFVAARAPQVSYHHFGTDDLDNGQPAEWFAKGVQAALLALRDPQRRVMVHCHMGVNRGPSMAFAILLALGVAPVEALDRIRASRPIAGIIYAADALEWWHRENETPKPEAAIEQLSVQLWHMRNAIDVSWIVSRIHTAGWA